MRIDNKQIIVVGASRGLGRGIAVALAGADARVLAIGRDQGALDSTSCSRAARVSVVLGLGSPNRSGRLPCFRKVEPLVSHPGLSSAPPLVDWAQRRLAPFNPHDVL
jgi:NAD(P)-dependent dehydrogenase (short-subunit alcohol dehydrogenase family)